MSSWAAAFGEGDTDDVWHGAWTALTCCAVGAGVIAALLLYVRAPIAGWVQAVVTGVLLLVVLAGIEGESRDAAPPAGPVTTLREGAAD
ncbi:DUF6234 family protein [Streptomyces hoynatensis]|uniref:DUF6234 family protein n=1 Tax=Streptomyces hoynatensis TaxID=1141874 RepID=UPI001576EE81|nr:hypothetical protein [Streptomyces hoynatensis]